MLKKLCSQPCERTAAVVSEYTVAPVYMKDESQGAHEWLIEFETAPESMNYFAEVLDNALKSLNSDYEAKRYKDFTLKLPIITSLPKGTFYNWMKMRGKLGGQNKVPRLYNSRKRADEILSIINKEEHVK